MKKILTIIACCLPLLVQAQIGEHRNQWTIGAHAGCNLNTISFYPNVPQKMHQGIEGGLIARYTCEKYFKSICAIQFEFNYAQLGWNESILDQQDQPVPLLSGSGNEQYKRTINYLQIPILAHMGWGKESRGFNFYVNAGPQLGYMLSESTETNFSVENANTAVRSSNTLYQDTMKVENKLDYGIVAGLGVEMHIRNVGRFQVEGRYYYGLGNIYGDSKRDNFGKSRHATITVRMAYLFDL